MRKFENFPSFCNGLFFHVFSWRDAEVIFYQRRSYIHMYTQHICTGFFFVWVFFCRLLTVIFHSCENHKFCSLNFCSENSPDFIFDVAYVDQELTPATSMEHLHKKFRPAPDRKPSSHWPHSARSAISEVSLKAVTTINMAGRKRKNKTPQIVI